MKSKFDVIFELLKRQKFASMDEIVEHLRRRHVKLPIRSGNFGMVLGGTYPDFDTSSIYRWLNKQIKYGSIARNKINGVFRYGETVSYYLFGNWMGYFETVTTTSSKRDFEMYLLKYKLYHLDNVIYDEDRKPVGKIVSLEEAKLRRRLSNG